MNRLSLTLISALAAILLAAPLTSALTCEEAIQAKLLAMYELDSSLYRVEILSHPLKAAELTPSELTLRPLSQKEPLGLFSMMVDVKSGGETLQSGQVRLKIRKYADVLVLLDKIHRSETITAEQFARQRMEITTLRERPLVDAFELSGKRARRNLKRGSILTARDLEPIPDVEHGRDVAIVYSDGLCRIATAGRALQSGLAGDYIKVKNKSSGKIILARVVDATAVAVDP
jgi:flagella basal body P-ring formation protein FlgA